MRTLYSGDVARLFLSVQLRTGHLAYAAVNPSCQCWWSSTYFGWVWSLLVLWRPWGMMNWSQVALLAIYAVECLVEKIRRPAWHRNLSAISYPNPNRWARQMSGWSLTALVMESHHGSPANDMSRWKNDRRYQISMSQFHFHYRIEPKEVKPWEFELWDIIILHRVLIRITGLRLRILNEKGSWHGVKMSQNK